MLNDKDILYLKNSLSLVLVTTGQMKRRKATEQMKYTLIEDTIWEYTLCLPSCLLYWVWCELSSSSKS